MAKPSLQKFKVTFSLLTGSHLTGKSENSGEGRPFPVEFHISRTSRDRYHFDQSLFAATGNVLIADFHAARVFAQKMNQQRDLLHHPETAVRAGDINAMGLIDEILHMVMQLYREEIKPGVLADALSWLENKVGKEALDKTLIKFLSEFPPVAVYRNEADITSYLQGKTENVPNRQITLEEMLMLWLANLNPAFNPFSELFDDQVLEEETTYLDTMTQLKGFFDTQPPVGPENKNLIDLLREPAIKCPDSLSAQLDYIRKNWGVILKKIAERLGRRLLLALDLIAEEEKVRFHPAFGPAPTIVPEYGELEEEPERFSPDLDWMPRTVLIAKSTLVWLGQLSNKYRRHIHRLDQIPDEELDRLAAWGFTGLWLIGVWQRSEASKKIKQLCGNPEAEASAYSLYDYAISTELGGEEAYQNLRERCWQRGIRLASDMVPNHMAID
ncbi:MAG: alpha-amylase family glycosyl hydrolase, partial [bacterium]